MGSCMSLEAETPQPARAQNADPAGAPSGEPSAPGPRLLRFKGSDWCPAPLGGDGEEATACSDDEVGRMTVGAALSQGTQRRSQRRRHTRPPVAGHAAGLALTFGAVLPGNRWAPAAVRRAHPLAAVTPPPLTPPSGPHPHPRPHKTPTFPPTPAVVCADRAPPRLWHHLVQHRHRIRRHTVVPGHAHQQRRLGRRQAGARAR